MKVVKRILLTIYQDGRGFRQEHILAENIISVWEERRFINPEVLGTGLRLVGGDIIWSSELLADVLSKEAL